MSSRSARAAGGSRVGEDGAMRIDVLGAVRARHDDGTPIALGGPRHR
ncbi:MAG: hypothetical protein HOY76_34155, partial [Streptomyces sp.]|nr:hypothetical protein [Streptomyces sp.]